VKRERKKQWINPIKIEKSRLEIPSFDKLYYGSCYSIFSFMCMFCRSLFVLLYFFFWPLCCLFLFLNVNWFLKKLLVFSVICQKKIRRVWRYQRGSQNPYIEEEQTTQWPKEKVQKDKQRSTKHTHKTKDRVTPEDLLEEEETENREEIRELPIYQHCRKINEEQFKVLWCFTQ
jgi:hypothetical protein